MSPVISCSPDHELLYLPVGDGVGEGVGQGEDGVAVWAGALLGEPAQQAAAAEPVAARRLLGLALHQQADGALVLPGHARHELEVVSALVVVSGHGWD